MEEKTEEQGPRDPTRREFLAALARQAGYTAPVIATYAVAPALLQGQSSLHKPPGHGHAPPAPGQYEPPSRPSDKHRPGQPDTD